MFVLMIVKRQSYRKTVGAVSMYGLEKNEAADGQPDLDIARKSSFPRRRRERRG